jgi:hypothetical protein
MAAHENKILITYTIMDQGFEEGTLMYVTGREDAEQGDLGTIVLPKPAGGVSIDPTLPDPVVFSYSRTVGTEIHLRVVLVKINSQAGTLSTCTVTVLEPAVDGTWSTIIQNVSLVISGGSTPALRNPHGLAQNGDWLYFIDYDNHLITIVGKNALETATSTSLGVAVCDLEEEGLFGNDARGQAIIALGGKIYALFISTNLATAATHGPGYLVRLNANTSTGALTLNASTRVGKNAQAIIPVTRKENGVDVDYLLIPAIGGEQHYNGTTNGTDSNICVVQALGTWNPSAAPIALTGNPNTTAPTAYDIHGIGAAMRNGSSKIFILTQVYNNNAQSAFWILYQTSVDVFLNFLTKTGNPYTLGEAKDLPGFKKLDEGIMVSPDPQVSDDIYFWDILYEQTLRDDDQEDRLWLVLGSPFLVTKAEAYGSPTTPLANPFVMFSGFGGINVNSVDLLIETLHQAKREVSLKRGLRSSRAARAAIAAGAEAAEEGGESEGK